MARVTRHNGRKQAVLPALFLLFVSFASVTTASEPAFAPILTLNANSASGSASVPAASTSPSTSSPSPSTGGSSKSTKSTESSKSNESAESTDSTNSRKQPTRPHIPFAWETSLPGLDYAAECEGDVALQDFDTWDVNTAPQFGHVEVFGDGAENAAVVEDTCFHVTAFDTSGVLFDNGCRQRAFFVGLLAYDANAPRNNEDRDEDEDAVSSGATADSDAAGVAGDGGGGVAGDGGGEGRRRKRMGRRSARETEPRQGVPGGGLALGAGLKVAADVVYVPASSSHKVCYQPPLPGRYLFSLHLTFTNAFQTARAIDARFSDGFVNYTVVLTRSIVATAPPNFAFRRYRFSLPACTSKIVTQSRNKGFWMNNVWHPHACILKRFSPQQALACLSNRNVLLMGDSEMRYFFGFLLTFIHYPSRALFVHKHSRDWKGFFPLARIPRGRAGDGPPLNDSDAANGRERVVRTHYSHTPAATYYGSTYSGFMRRSYNLSNAATQFKLIAFNLTYVTQIGSQAHVLADWMTNPRMTGGETAFDGKPFDSVLYSCFLHDLIFHQSRLDYRGSMSNHLLPQLRRYITDPSAVTFLGPWSAREDAKPNWALHISNNARGHAFEDEAARVLPHEGFPNLVQMRFTTLARPDLCMDSTHYSWPVTLAMLDTWLTTICNGEKIR